MKRVFTTADLVLAGLVESLLASAGIACTIRNQYLAGAVGELPPNECWPQVWVLDEADGAAAERLIAETLAARGSDVQRWACAQCGEMLEGQFEQCWQCGALR